VHNIIDEFDLFRVKHNDVKHQRGLSLLSIPLSHDHFFKNTVVLLTEHNNQGSIGFIVNRPMDYTLHQVISDIPETDIPLFYGGPVANDSIHFIHSLGTVIPMAVKVKDGLYWGGDFSVMKQLLRNDSSIAASCKFFVGYAGWTTGQLDKEIETDFWLVTDVESSKIIGNQSTDLWTETLQSMGFKYKLWSTFPEDANYN